MQQRKKSQGDSKEGGVKKSRAAKLKAEVPDKLEPAVEEPRAEVPGKSELYIRYPVPKSEEEVAPEVKSPAMPFPSVKPDHIRMFCNRCGHRLTLQSQNPGTPGSGPYQGYCRFPCGVEYIVRVNLIG